MSDDVTNRFDPQFHDYVKSMNSIDENYIGNIIYYN